MEPHLSPGPWTTDGECGDESVLDAKGFMVADCAIFATPRPAAENVANARAIALLPQLIDYAESMAMVGCPEARALVAMLPR